MANTKSSELLGRAKELLPGGVNSPVRAFRAVLGDPIFIAEAGGAWLTDADGNKYVDYVGSWGPMILGHAHPHVVAAVQRAMARGASFGAPCPGEVDLAEAIRGAYPSMQMLRMTSSGTEAVMGALRAARGFTGRELVVKFEGCYHGGADYLLVKAGSGAATFGEPDSAGVPAGIAATTLVLPFNDEAAARALFAARGRDIAALIVEPVVGNMGCVPPEDGFLPLLRELTRDAGALLVLDEVMTGFRVAYGGAQALYGIEPDLTTLGKIVGGGLPVGVYGGSEPGLYERLEASGKLVEEILVSAAARARVDLTVQRAGSMLTPFFTQGPVRSWVDAARADRARFARFHRALLDHGMYWPPSQFEAGFVSLAHDAAALDATRRAVEQAMAGLS